MPDDTIRRQARHAAKADRLGQYACCARCGDTETLHLQTASVTLCAECRLLLEQRATSESHHPAGRKNDAFTVPIPANDHAVLSDAQCDWPNETLRNPDRSPLLAASAAIRGWLDVLQLMIERSFGWIPPFLEWLDGALRTRIGEAWWNELGWNGGLTLLC